MFFEHIAFSEESKMNSELDRIPVTLQTINVYGNITEIWQILMESEPSLYKKTTYVCGHSKIKAISTIFVNHNTIQERGFQSLEDSLITYLHINANICEKDGCSSIISSRFSVNAHVFIELDVRKTENLNQSMTSKLEDFPLQISLQVENLRYFFTQNES